ncbi:protein of unknown function [Burkholderia multivorans]
MNLAGVSMRSGLPLFETERIGDVVASSIGTIRQGTACLLRGRLPHVFTARMAAARLRLACCAVRGADGAAPIPANREHELGAAVSMQPSRCREGGADVSVA